MMRVTTLKATAAGVGGLLAYYAGLAEDRTRTGPSRGPVDYYLDPDEPAGRWWGQGRAGFGVEGEVEADQLRAVLEGRHPVSGSALGRAFGEASAPGFDATFSAPKSVSVLWALTPDPWIRAEVLAAHDRAVDAALDWFEQHGAVTRRGRDGTHQVDTRGATAALFRQHTSRTVDPQLHTHALISSKVQDPTGRWLALDAGFLKYQQRTIGWVYDAALRSELTHRLGVEWSDMTGGQADLTSIPTEVRDAFSQRSTQVTVERDRLLRAWADRHDGREPDRLTIARLARAIGRGVPANHLEVLRTTSAMAQEPLGDDVAELTFTHRAGISMFPVADLAGVTVTKNNRAVLLPRATVSEKMAAAAEAGLFVPLPLWYRTYASSRPPDLYLAQRAEYDALFSPAAGELGGR